MTWLTWSVYAWLAFAILGGLVLYIGYGFVMVAVMARDKKEGASPAYVVKIDALLATPIVLLDGLYNAVVMPVLCLDLRLSMAFRKVTVKGVTLPFFELVTERLSRYNEAATEPRYRRWLARHIAQFLDAKDPKGWHVRKPHPEAKR